MVLSGIMYFRHMELLSTKLCKMTIGTSTFYTINSFFAIEIFGFFQYFFEFIVNFALFLCFLNKFFIFLLCKKRLCNFFTAKDIFGRMSHFFRVLFGNNHQISSFLQLISKKVSALFVQIATVNYALFSGGFFVHFTSDSDLKFTVYMQTELRHTISVQIQTH